MFLGEFFKNEGLAVAAYDGDGAVLLAFAIDEEKTQNLAGFAVKAVTPDSGPYSSNEYWLKNRLSFNRGLSRETALTTGHFGRFAHNKVMIQKENGKATKVLTGSANFSLRGLYVQANSVFR